MYRVLKDKGNNASVTLENLDTRASIIIGKLSMDIIRILEAQGYVFDTDKDEAIRSLRDAWNLSVSDETATKLSKIAMSISKPPRDQSKKSKQSEHTENKPVIDAMDVLLGLAKY